MRELLNKLIFEKITEDNLNQSDEYVYCLRIKGKDSKNNIATVTWFTDNDKNMIQIIIMNQKKELQELYFESKVKNNEFTELLIDIASLVNIENKRYKFVNLISEFENNNHLLCAFINENTDVNLWNLRTKIDLFISGLEFKLNQYLKLRGLNA